MNRNEAKTDLQIVEAEENFLIDFQFLVQDLIDSKKMSRTELAKRAGITKARLSQILSAEANPTVKTFARLFHALNSKVAIQAIPERREIVLPARPGVGQHWQVEQMQEAEMAESRRVKNKRHIESLFKKWRGASNDNCVVVASDANSFRLKAA